MDGDRVKDNKTSQPAREYDKNIEKTIPRYRLFQEEIFSLVSTVCQNPGTWLDTGGGTGILIHEAAKLFNSTKFVLADPSKAMLDIAKEKFAYPGNPEYIMAGTEEIACPDESFDIITAVLSHHYFDMDTRKKATENCYRMLRKNGLYITFESIRLNSERATDIGLKRWLTAQIKNGKSPEGAERHIKRFGIEFLPISVDSHLRILQHAGFATAEILALCGMQAGFYAIK